MSRWSTNVIEIPLFQKLAMVMKKVERLLTWRRCAKAADITGIRALFVHAKDEQAIAFYQHFNFRPSPTDPQHLFLLMKDILKILAL
jgi:hypothetical protein